MCLTKKSFVLSMQRILNAWGAFLNGAYDQLMTPKKLKIALESLLSRNLCASDRMIRDNLRVRLYLRLLSVEKGKKMSSA